jgi:hypothetical protein
MTASTLSTPLGPSAQAAYGELLEVTRHQELARSIENLSGSFNRKTVKGIPYWYYQFTDAGGGLRQIFVGRDDDTLRALVERAKSRNTLGLDRLAKAAAALGCAATTPAHFRIVRRLNEVGFFRAGGVLVGTHAFLALGNALGVAWGDLARTQDIDFAHAGTDVAVALPASLHIATRNALESLEAGFLPVPGFRPKDKTATFLSRSDRQLRVDFLAPMIGGRAAVYAHQTLGVNLHPMRFMEYLLEDIDQAAVLSAVGAVLINVPDPARYALHKLLVYADRRLRAPTKAAKDLRQSAALLEVLADFRSAKILALWRDLLDRGPGWRSRARIGLRALEELTPALPVLPAMRELLVPRPRAAESPGRYATKHRKKP